MFELVGGGSVINGLTLSSFKKIILLRIAIFFNEGLSNHSSIIQVYTVLGNKLASYAFASKPTVHSG